MNYTLENFRQLPSNSADEIAKLTLPEGDVLSAPEDIRVRRTNLDKALSLATSKKVKTAIIIKSTSGLKKIETGVTAFDGSSLFTSGGLKIPLTGVYSFDFYS